MFEIFKRWLIIFLIVLDNLSLINLGWTRSFSLLSQRRSVLVLLPFFTYMRFIGLLRCMIRIKTLALMSSISPFLGGFGSLFMDDIGSMFEIFHKFAYLPHDFSSFFVTLISNVDPPSQIGDF